MKLLECELADWREMSTGNHCRWLKNTSVDRVFLHYLHLQGGWEIKWEFYQQYQHTNIDSVLQSIFPSTIFYNLEEGKRVVDELIVRINKMAAFL